MQILQPQVQRAAFWMHMLMIKIVVAVGQAVAQHDLTPVEKQKIAI